MLPRNIQQTFAILNNLVNINNPTVRCDLSLLPQRDSCRDKLGVLAFQCLYKHFSASFLILQLNIHFFEYLGCNRLILHGF